MSPMNIFEDYDLLHVYLETQNFAVRNDALNFVLEFGAHASNIASNVHASDLSKLLDGTTAGCRASQTPARWM